MNKHTTKGVGLSSPFSSKLALLSPQNQHYHPHSGNGCITAIFPRSVMKHHESLPYALNRIAKELEVLASKFSNNQRGRINKLLQDAAYLKQASEALQETVPDE